MNKSTNTPENLHESVNLLRYELKIAEIGTPTFYRLCDSLKMFTDELRRATAAVRRFKSAINQRRLYSRHSKRWIKFS